MNWVAPQRHPSAHVSTTQTIPPRDLPLHGVRDVNAASRSAVKYGYACRCLVRDLNRSKLLALSASFRVRRFARTRLPCLGKAFFQCVLEEQIQRAFDQHRLFVLRVDGTMTLCACDWLEQNRGAQRRVMRAQSKESRSRFP